MKINNIILVLRTRIILLSSFVIYVFCICHSGRFPIIQSTKIPSESRIQNASKATLFLWDYNSNIIWHQQNEKMSLFQMMYMFHSPLQAVFDRCSKVYRAGYISFVYSSAT